MRHPVLRHNCVTNDDGSSFSRGYFFWVTEGRWLRRGGNLFYVKNPELIFSEGSRPTGNLSVQHRKMFVLRLKVETDRSAHKSLK